MHVKVVAAAAGEATTGEESGQQPHYTLFQGHLRLPNAHHGQTRLGVTAVSGCGSFVPGYVLTYKNALRRDDGEVDLTEGSVFLAPKLAAYVLPNEKRSKVHASMDGLPWTFIQQRVFVTGSCNGWSGALSE